MDDVASSVAGTRVSPLHNRFPISSRIPALLEAEPLTSEKVKL